MAADDLVSKIEFDTTGAGAAIDRLEKDLKKYNLTVDDLARATRRVNSEQKNYGITLEFLSKAGQHLVVTLDDIAKNKAPEVAFQFNEIETKAKDMAKATAEATKQFDLQQKILKDLAQAHDKLQQAVKKTKEAENARQLLKNVLTQNTSTQNASQKEIVDLNTAINKVVRDLGKGKYTIKEFLDGVTSVGTKGASAFLDMDQSLSVALFNTLKAVDNIGNEYTVAGQKAKAASDKAIAASDKALNKLFDETEALRKKAVLEQTAARTAESARQSLIKLLGSGGTLSKATDKEVIGLNKAINAVSKSIGEGTFTLTEFTNTLADVGVKGSSAFLGLNKEMTQAVGTTLNAIVKLGETHYKSKAKIKEAYDKTIAKVREELGLINEETAAIQAKTQAEAHAATIFLKAKDSLNKAYAAGDTKGLEKQDAILGKISALFTKAAFTAKDYNTVLDAMAGGSGGVAALGDAHQKLAALIIRFRDEGVKSYDRVKKGAKEYIDLINTMRDALQRAAAAQNLKSVNQVHGGRRADLVSSQLQQLIPQKIDSAGLQRANDIIVSIRKQFLSGKANMLDYIRAQASLNGASLTLTGSQQRLLNSLKALQKEFNKTGDAAKASGTKILLNLSQLAKLFVIQTLHRSLTNLIGVFRNATTTAVDFGIKIGEILTISQGGSKGFNEWSNEVRNLSDLFGQDTATVAKGTYDALSNQVIVSANSYGFLSEALKFSQTTASTAENGINLLSSALKSFRLDTSETQRVAAIMFKTIELGRVTADEMANSFGRIGSLAHSLGISLEETNSALAVLTNQGIKFDEAATLINNIMLKLIKPTDEMKLLFREWGVESGQAAIATFGFEGVLKKFDQEAQKGTARLGDLFSELRAVRAAVGLTGDAFKDYSGVLGEVSNASLPSYLRAQDLVLTDAKKLQIEFNKVKNFFTVDVGQGIVKALLTASNYFGGFVAVTKRALTALTAVTLGFVAFKVVSSGFIQAIFSSSRALLAYIANLRVLSTSAQYSAFRVNALKVSLAGVSIPALALGASVALLTEVFINVADASETSKERMERFAAELEPKYTALAEVQIALGRRVLEEESKVLEERLQKFRQYSAAIQQANNKLVDVLKARNKESLDAFKVYIDILTKAIDKSVQESKNKLDELIALKEKAEAQSAKITDRAPNEKFDRTVDAQANPEVQAKLIENEINRLSAEIQAARAAGKANTLEELQNIEKTAERAMKLAEQLAELRASNNAKLSKQEEAIQKKEAAAAAQRIEKQLRNSEADLARVNKLLLGKGLSVKDQIALQQEQRALQDRVDKEKALEQAQKDVATAKIDNAAAILASEKELLNTQVQRLIVLKEIADLAYKEAAKAKEQLLIQEAAKIKTEASAEAFIKFQPKIDEDAVAGKNLADTTAELAKQEAEARAEFQKLQDELIANVNATGVEALDLQNKLDERRAAAFKEFEATRNGLLATAATKEIADRAANAKKLIEDEQKKFDELKALQIANTKSLEENLNEFEARLKETTGSDREAPIIAKIRELIAEYSSTGNPRVLEQIAAARQTLVRSIQDLGDTNRAGVLGQETIQPLLNMLLSINTSILKMNREAKQISEARKALDEYNAQLIQINRALTDWTGKVDDVVVANAAANISLRDQLTQTLTSINDVGAAYRNLAADIKAAADAYNVITSFFVPDGKVHGGSIPAFAGGGFVKKGFDTQVAAVAPGEFIMNRQSTMRNYTQFVAMNQGRQPRNFVQGGNVTTVGDVNITVQGGNNSAQTVSEIGRGLQREIRMKRLKFS